MRSMDCRLHINGKLWSVTNSSHIDLVTESKAGVCSQFGNYGMPIRSGATHKKLRIERNLLIALVNGEKDREFKEFVGYHASVCHCPQMPSEVYFGSHSKVHFGFCHHLFKIFWRFGWDYSVTHELGSINSIERRSEELLNNGSLIGRREER